MKKTFLLSIIVVCAVMLSKGQEVINVGKVNKSTIQVNNYNRNALSMILINFQGEHQKEILKEFVKLKVPSKFDDNTLPVQFIPQFISGSSESNLKYDIHNALLDNHVGNAIISKWYNQQPDGSFNMETIKKRGIYNATDLDVVNASISRKGEDLIKDSGEKLLKNSYVLVMSYPIMKTMEEYYNEEKKPYNERALRGWTGTYEAYLYRLNWSDSIASIFYNKYWVNSDDSPQQKKERKEKFDKQNYSMTFVTHSIGHVNGTTPINENKYLTDDDLLSIMLSAGIDNAEYEFSSKSESFKVETAVFYTNPIRAKIGSKEGLRVDDRYFIYENVQNRRNEVKSVRKGVARVKRIINNENEATGQSTKTSTFYQIGGGHVQEGMLLKQKNDKGFGITPLYISGSDNATPAGYGAEVEHLTKISPGLKGKIGFAIENKEIYIWNYYSGSSQNNSSFTRFYLGISKSMYFATHFQFEPSICLGYETSSEITDKKLGAYYFEPNLRLGINLNHNIQLLAGAGYYYFLDITDIEFKKPTTGEYANKSWTDIFPGRSGVSFDFGFRFQF